MTDISSFCEPYVCTGEKNSMKHLAVSQDQQRSGTQRWRNDRVQANTYGKLEVTNQNQHQTLL